MILKRMLLVTHHNTELAPEKLTAWSDHESHVHFKTVKIYLKI